MLDYVNGDLMKAPELVIMHGCNAQRTMGKGVAKLIRAQFPYAYEQYLQGSQTLGDVIFAIPPTDDGKIIANAITQDKFRKTYDDDNVQYVDYDAIEQSFKTVNQFCKENGIDTIAVPKIGAGLAGGDWAIIEQLIVKSTPDITVKVYCI